MLCCMMTFETLNKVCVALHCWSLSIMDYVYILGQLTYISTYAVLHWCVALHCWSLSIMDYVYILQLGQLFFVHTWYSIDEVQLRMLKEFMLADIQAYGTNNRFQQECLARMLSFPEKEAYTHNTQTRR